MLAVSLLVGWEVGCLVLVCVVGIPNRGAAGTDDIQSSHTLSKNAHITSQGKRNMFPSQTKHNDGTELFVDTRCAAGAVMAFVLENLILLFLTIQSMKRRVEMNEL